MPDPTGPVAAGGDDCAVIAAVAREHYAFNTTDSLSPPLWLDDEGTGWAPRCDWSRYGLSFPEIHDPARTPASASGCAGSSFEPPRYDGRGRWSTAPSCTARWRATASSAGSAPVLPAGPSATAASPGSTRPGWGLRRCGRAGMVASEFSGGSMRRMLISSVSVLLLAACAGTAAAMATAPSPASDPVVAAPASSEDARLNAFFEQAFQDRIALSPQSMTSLGTQDGLRPARRHHRRCGRTVAGPGRASAGGS